MIRLVVHGGYTGGNSEYLDTPMQNGLSGRGGVERDCDPRTPMGGTGGSGYFEKGEDTWTLDNATVGNDFWTSFGGVGYREIAGNIGGGAG